MTGSETHKTQRDSNENPGLVMKVLNQSGIRSKYRNDEAAQRKLLNHLNSVANTLDSKFQIPGIRLRFGWDALIGVVPVIGDLAGGGISLYLIARAVQIGAPWHLVRKMLRNLVIEVGGGALPIIGDAFDMVYKANNKNMRMLTDYLDAQLSPPPEPDSGWKAYMVPAAALGIIIGFSWLLMRWI